MITVPEIVHKIVFRSPYLSEGMQKNIINLSALAREILPEVEESTMKEVEIGSVIMALTRMRVKLQEKKDIFNTETEIIVRSNLIEITVKNSDQLIEAKKNLLQLASRKSSQFATITHGVFETTIIASSNVNEELIRLFTPEYIISEISHLSSITIKFSTNIINTPGIYAYILNQLAWNGIAITEIVSTFSELTVIIKDEVVSEAFAIIKKTLSNG